MVRSTSKRIDKLLARKRGILLDISLGGVPQEGAVTMLDLRHDPRVLPYPLPDGCVHTAVITHVLEYLEPSQFFAFWDEMHRIVRLQGSVYVSGPYGGDGSHGWLSDPTHKTRVVEQSFAWLDPRLPFYDQAGTLGRSIPKPWHTIQVTRVPGTHGTTGYNVQLQSQAVNGYIDTKLNNKWFPEHLRQKAQSGYGQS